MSAFVFRYDPQTDQWSCDVAPTTSCRTSVGVAVLDNLLYAVGGQDGVQCLNHVERYVHAVAVSEETHITVQFLFKWPYSTKQCSKKVDQKLGNVPLVQLLL